MQSVSIDSTNHIRIKIAYFNITTLQRGAPGRRCFKFQATPHLLQVASVRFGHFFNAYCHYLILWCQHDAVALNTREVI